MTYNDFIGALKNKKVTTIEMDPSYGKYHYDGHRKCNVCMSPTDSIKNKDICPKCKKMLTIGEVHRVVELADRPEGFKPKDAQEFKTLIPLSEIISALIGSPVASTKVWPIYNQLIDAFDSEYNVLLNVEKEKLVEIVSEELADAIIKNRNQEIEVKPGYDGMYGVPILGKKKEKTKRFKNP